MNDQFVISSKEAQQILDYLVQRPYIEVFDLISKLTALPSLPKIKEEVSSDA